MKNTNCLLFLFIFLFIASEKAFANDSHLKMLPKAELHLHLGGSIPKEYLLSIADDEERKELIDALAAVKARLDYCDAFAKFQAISKILCTEERLEEGVFALTQALQEDGVCCVEIRTGLKDLGGGYEGYLKAVLRGIEKGSSDQFCANVVLSLQRHSSEDFCRETINLAKKYFGRGVSGIDISGDATKGDILQILPLLKQVRDEGVPFLVHIGEQDGEEDQMALLEALRPARVGHAVHLTKEAKEWILQQRIPIEVCLTSSYLAKMVDSIDEHPGLLFYRSGHPIVFATDDPLLFDTTLSSELELALSLGLSLEEVFEIVDSSFDYLLEVPPFLKSEFPDVRK